MMSTCSFPLVADGLLCLNGLLPSTAMPRPKATGKTAFPSSGANFG